MMPLEGDRTLTMHLLGMEARKKKFFGTVLSFLTQPGRLFSNTAQLQSSLHWSGYANLTTKGIVVRKSPTVTVMMLTAEHQA